MGAATVLKQHPNGIEFIALVKTKTYWIPGLSSALAGRPFRTRKDPPESDLPVEQNVRDLPYCQKNGIHFWNTLNV
jgi:hypothetical protein